MASLVLTLHVVGAVFVFGPLAVLPMTGLRAMRTGGSAQVRGLSHSLSIFAWLSLVVALAGIAYIPLAPERWHLSLTTGWVLWSIVLTAVAITLSLIVIIPQMNSAAATLEVAKKGTRPREYAAVASSSGIVSMLLVVVAVIMVIH